MQICIQTNKGVAMKVEDHSEGLDKYIPSEVQEVLAIRLVTKSFKYILGVLAFFSIILGYVGFDLVGDINKSKVQLQEQVNEAQELIERLNGKLVSLKNETSSGKLLLENLKNAIDSNQDFFRENLILLGKNNSQSEINQTLIKKTIDKAENSIAKLDSIEKNIEIHKKETADSLKKIKTFEIKIDSIEVELFQSGSFVVREKIETPLSGLPLKVKMATIRGNTLREFELLERDGGKRLFGPEDIVLGQNIPPIRNGEQIIKIMPRYIVELFFGKDMAGLDVRIIENR